MAPSDRQIAGIIGGRYEIAGLLASGGMGSVYRAYDTVLERHVALKVLHQDADPSFASRLRAEATNAARLSHPAIVHVYDFGFEGDAPYIAMEFVEGQTMRDVLNERSVLRPDLAARIAAQVAAALEHARRAGIMHRDVKPENILITRDGRVKVTDFGLSHVISSSNATGPLLGTPHYLAPEQVRGGDVDHRADVYALGIVLYEALTGRPPFTGDTQASIALARVNADVPSPMGINPGVPRALDAVVLRATARDPVERFQTPGLMAEALRSDELRADTQDLGALVHHTSVVSLDNEPTVAIPRGARTTERRKRKRLILIIAAVVALSLVGGSFFVADRFATVKVPSVRGLTQEQARAALYAEGLRIDVELQNHPTAATGTVILQNPGPGAAVRDGSTVTVTVSLGPEQVGVPDVKSMLFADAEALLIQRGFKVKRVDAFDPVVRRLHVISQSLEEGVLVQRGATVTLTVSKGPELVRVPDVVGDPAVSARADLVAAGFEVTEKHELNETVPAGDVVSQSLKAGARVKKGSKISIVVSDGPPLVEVPNLDCMRRAQAEEALKAKGFKAKFEGSGSYVVDQDPGAGTKAPKGSTVTAFLSIGNRCT